jgi:iron(III) transport system ATP-binding protein
LGTTAIYVTHDQAEALVLADTLIIMNNGKIIQTGNPYDIYKKPNSKFVADFIGLANIIQGKFVKQAMNGFSGVSHNGLTMICKADKDIKEGENVFICIRPEDIRLYKSKPQDAINTWQGTVTQTVFLGNIQNCIVKISNLELNIQLDSYSKFTNGEIVYVQIPVDRFNVFPLENLKSRT